MMMMMNGFCGMVDGRKAFSFISSRYHCQRSWPSRISDTPRAGFEPAQSLSSGLVEWSCAVVITTTPRRHNSSFYLMKLHLMLSKLIKHVTRIKRNVKKLSPIKYLFSAWTDARTHKIHWLGTYQQTLTF